MTALNRKTNSLGSLGEKLAVFQPALYHGDARNFSFRHAGKWRGNHRENGVPLVLLHGIASGSASWLYQFESLAGEFGMVAWDAPGYGDSDMIGRTGANVDDYARALHQWLCGLELTKVHLVGHSLGALVAGAFAKLYPDSLSSLILVDPASGYGDAALEVREGVVSTRSGMIEAIGPDGVAEKRAANLLSDTADSEALALVQWNMRRLRYGGYSQAIELLAHGNLLADAACYKGPVLVMCGSCDHVTPPEKAKEVCRHYCNAEYQELAGAGHAAYIDKPETFNQALREFIRRQA